MPWTGYVSEDSDSTPVGSREASFDSLHGVAALSDGSNNVSPDRRSTTHGRRSVGDESFASPGRDAAVSPPSRRRGDRPRSRSTSGVVRFAAEATSPSSAQRPSSLPKHRRRRSGSDPRPRSSHDHDDDVGVGGSYHYGDHRRDAATTSASAPPTTTTNKKPLPKPSLEPYYCRLEKFELYSTHSTYYLVACDKHEKEYRVLRFDRTLIEKPTNGGGNDGGGGGGGGGGGVFSSRSTDQSDGPHGSNPYNSNHHNNPRLTPSAPPSSLPRSPTRAHAKGYQHQQHQSPYSHHQQQQQQHSYASQQQQQRSPSHGHSSQYRPSSNHHDRHSHQHRPHNNPHGHPHSYYHPYQDGGRRHDATTSMHRDDAAAADHDYHNPPSPGGDDATTPHQQHSGSASFRRLPDFCAEDPHAYDAEEIRITLDAINEGHARSGGLRSVVKAYGIVGCVKFLDCYYLTLITDRNKVGSLGSNGIYSIKNTETFPLKPARRPDDKEDGGNNSADPSSMLLSMWNRGKRAAGLGVTQREIAELRYQELFRVIDTTKNYYFSYTYDMTRSLQENFLAMTARTFPPPPTKDMYAWNHFLTRELEECCDSSATAARWVLPVTHGAFVQRRIVDYGRTLDLALLARRSRHFAGTRYLKRGVSDQGKVANDVEHEQILRDFGGGPAAACGFSSFLQMRGSIPTYWTQESSVTMPKPPIVLNRVDPTYRATRAHFADVLRRYGSPVVVVDLVKQTEKREREVIVGNEFRHAIDHLNSYMVPEHRIRYCALDYSHISKHRALNVSTSLNEVSTWSVNQTGFFCSRPRWRIREDGSIEPFETPKETEFLSEHLGVPVFPMEQKGVLRTNCIDCLDRTNVAQFSAGVASLAQQLVVLGIRSSVKLDPTSNIVRVLIDMYVEIGDHIALQYGGSEAHKKVTNGAQAKEGPSAGKHKELLTSIRRYYSNSFTDRLKQDAMNLFLGYYIPYRHTVPLWDMESDYYLHNFQVRAGMGAIKSMKGYEKAFAVDWSDDEDDDRPRDGASVSPARRKGGEHRRLSSLDELVVHRDNDGLDAEGRMERVRRRCNAQNEALSVWWRAAIRGYIQQRTSMRFGRDPPEALVPSRLDRLYPADRLTKFDKFFERSFETPIRLSHSAQHAQSADDAKETIRSSVTTEERRKYKTHHTTTSIGERGKEEDDDSNQSDSDSEDSHYTIDDFVTQHSYKPATDPTLTYLMRHYDNEYRPSSRTLRGNQRRKLYPKANEEDEKSRFLGNPTDSSPPCEEYEKYANYVKDYDYPFRKFRPGVQEEFKRILHDNNLDSADVKGIRQLAESAHIGGRIRSGCYRGLPQDTSAIRVTTVINEHYDAFTNMRNRLDSNKKIGKLLKQNKMDTGGVREEIILGWEQSMQAEDAYGEIIDMSSVGYRRSDFTTARSMEMYCSFYDDDTTLSRLNRMYITGNSSFNGSNKKTSKKKKKKKKKGAKKKTDNSYQFAFLDEGQTYREHEEFEQINEDLYARKDNKFMVFNGVGVDTWHGTNPVTKVGGIEKDIFLD